MSVDFRSKVSFAQIVSDPAHPRDEDEDGTTVFLWPCVAFENISEFNSAIDELQKMIEHGLNERMEYKANLFQVRAASTRQSNEAHESLGSRQPPPPIDQTPLIYFLGKSETLPENLRLTTQLKFKVYKFSDKLSDAMEGRHKVEGFNDAIREAFLLVEDQLGLNSTRNKSELNNANPKPTKMTTEEGYTGNATGPTGLLDPSMEVERPSIVTDSNCLLPAKPTPPPFNSSAGFSWSNAVFVPLFKRGLQDKIFWPAMRFDDVDTLIKELQACHLMSRDPSDELKLFREANTVGKERDGPFAYLFGKAPFSGKILSVGDRKDIVGYNYGMPRLHACAKPSYWSAIIELANSVMGHQASRDRTTQSDAVAKLPARTVSVKLEKTDKKPRKPSSKRSHALSDISNEVRNPPKKQKSEKKAPTKVTAPVELPKQQPRYGYKEIESIPEFNDVKEVLLKAGYTFVNGFYCMPGKDPLKDTQGLFKSEEEFRAHLCVSGTIPVGSKMRARDMDPDQKSCLEAYVCYHRVAKLLGEKKLSTVKMLQANDGGTSFVMSLLTKKLGWTWSQGKWSIPDITEKYDEEALAKRGLPDECKLDCLEEKERIDLELYISDPKNRLGSMIVDM